MKRLPLEVHPEAEEDYRDALAWYAEQSFPAAARFVDAVRHSLERIEDSPQRWPIYFSHFRKYTFHDFPFSIVYQIESSRTFVLAIAHGRRKPGYWRGRV